MDYGTLAQLSNPGASPLQTNPGIVDIEGLSNHRNLAQMRLESLRSAQPLAAMDLEKQQQAQKEYMMGASGREDMVSLANMKAKNAPNEYTRDQMTKDLEHALKDTDLRKKLTDATEDIGGEGDAFVNADDATKRTIKDSLRGKKLRNGYVMGTDDAKDDQVLTVAGKVRASDPKLQVKRDVQGQKNEGALAVADVKGQWAQKTAAERNEVMLDIAKMRQASDAAKAANKPLSADQQFYESVKRIAGGDDATIYALWSQYKAATQQAKTEAELELMKKFNIKVPERPAQAPVIPGGGAAAPAKATTTPAKPKFEVGKIYTDKNGVKAKFTEKGWELVQEGK